MTISQTINSGLRRVPTWPVYLLGSLPPLWYFWQGLDGQLGPEPIKTLEHLVGLLALQMLIVTLAVTPLRRFTGINLIRYRRAFGLLAFYYVSFHLAVWLFLDIGDVSLIWADIVKRWYITIGMAAFALLIPLALTSNNWAIRKLGPRRWKRVHQLGYGAALLGALHFVILVKGFQLEPLIYMGLVGLLLLARIDFKSRKLAAG
ncbi:MAG: protein-methionine-sulfoxide reductase heme-binding subunit MsrQ [Rhodobacteraceae bacterium]|nr:protein-methionine-sulfoxide reductase heme-binding subunit MsrQ [Paracoccaceae bacterium]